VTSTKLNGHSILVIFSFKKQNFFKENYLLFKEVLTLLQWRRNVF